MQIGRVNTKQLRLSLAFLIIGMSSTIVLILGLFNRSSVFHYQQAEVAQIADVATLTFEDNIETYIYTLYGVRGLVYSSNQVTRAEFNTFITSLALPRRLPGTTAIGFAKLVSESERVDFVNEVRYDTTLDRGGYPEFAISPTPLGAESLVVTFVEPSNLTSSREALGFDMLSDEGRRIAFESARDDNRTMMTSTVRAISGEHNAFVLMLPVYDQTKRIVSIDERRQAVTGVIAMSLKRTSLFNSSFDLFLQKNPSLRIRVFDGTEASEDTLVYDSNLDKQVLGITCCENEAIETRIFERAGRTWLIEYTLPQQSTALAVPYPVLALPLLLIVLFSGVGLAISLRLVRPISI